MSSLANIQAKTRVNAEQAPKRVMREPTLLQQGEGRRRFGKKSDTMHRAAPAGVMALACMEEGRRGNTGSPVGGVARINRNPVRGRPGRQGGGQARKTEDAG